MSASTTRLWNAVRDMAVLDGMAPERAEREADEMIHRIEIGKEHEVAVQREHRMRRLGKAGIVLAWVGTIALVLGGVAAGLIAIDRHNDKDFAGYGQGKSVNHARYAITAFYGRDNAPRSLRYVARKHDNVFGQKTWKVTFRRPDGEPVCAWVWLDGDAVPGSYTGPDTDDNWIVRTGAQC